MRRRDKIELDHSFSNYFEMEFYLIKSMIIEIISLKPSYNLPIFQTKSIILLFEAYKKKAINIIFESLFENKNEINKKIYF